MYNDMTIVNNMELYTWNLIKAKILGVCIMKKEITVWGNWYASQYNYCDYFTKHMYAEISVMQLKYNFYLPITSK